jgi:hypothetical protein
MALYSREVPVYWKQRYAGRGQRHRAWVKRQAAREEALRAAAGPSLWERFRRRIGRTR